MYRFTLLLNIGLLAQLGACGGSSESDPTESSKFSAPTGEELAFGVKEGNLRNYFHRQGPSAVHLLMRSGTDQRLIAAFPANNQGIGLWFTPDDASTQLWVGADNDADLPAGGGVTSVVRHDEARDMNGVRATVHS